MYVCFFFSQVHISSQDTKESSKEAKKNINTNMKRPQTSEILGQTIMNKGINHYPNILLV